MVKVVMNSSNFQLLGKVIKDEEFSNFLFNSFNFISIFTVFLILLSLQLHCYVLNVGEVSVPMALDFSFIFS